MKFTSVLLLCLCASLALVHSYTFDLITDIGVDPFYGIYSAYGSCTTPQSGAAGYGKKGCETPINMVAELGNDIVNHDYLLILGGWQRKQASSQATLSIVFSYLSEFFGAIETTGTFPRPNTITGLGGSDSVPENYFNPSASTQLILQQEVALIQNNLLTGSESTTMATCGFYSRQPSSDLRILVLYTLVWSTRVQPAATSTDPCGQFAWLEAELQSAKQAGQRVIVMGHLPPTLNVSTVTSQTTAVDGSMLNWLPEFVESYAGIISRYSDTISFQVFGGTYQFSFVANTAMGVPLFTVNSVSQLFGTRSAHTVATVSEDGTYTLQDLIPRLFDSTTRTWSAGTNIAAALGLTSLSSVAELQQAAVNLQTDDALWATYNSIRTTGSSEAPSCNTEVCRKFATAAMQYVTLDELNNALFPTTTTSSSTTTTTTTSSQAPTTSSTTTTTTTSSQAPSTSSTTTTTSSQAPSTSSTTTTTSSRAPSTSSTTTTTMPPVNPPSSSSTTTTTSKAPSTSTTTSTKGPSTTSTQAPSTTQPPKQGLDETIVAIKKKREEKKKLGKKTFLNLAVSQSSNLFMGAQLSEESQPQK